MSAFLEKSDYKSDSKSQAKSDTKSHTKSDYKSDYKSDAKLNDEKDIDGLDDVNDLMIRKTFDHNKSIEEISRIFFKYDLKKAWDNIIRINGRQSSKHNHRRNVIRNGVYGLKDAKDYKEVEESIFHPIVKLKQATIDILDDKQPKNIPAKKVLDDINLNRMINNYFGGKTRYTKSKKGARKTRRSRKCVKVIKENKKHVK
jgi:hypothetical protein